TGSGEGRAWELGLGTWGLRSRMALRAQRIAVAALVDVHLQRELVARSVRDVTVRARDGAGLEAAAERQRLRTVETVRAAVRPEFALQIVVGQRIADKKRRGVIRVAIAAPESDESVALVAVTVSASVVDAPRLRALDGK